MMEIFVIREEGIKEIRKKVLTRIIPLLTVVGIAGITVSYLNSSHNEDDINVLPFLIPIVVFALGIGVFRGLRRQKALLSSYTLTIYSNLITREQVNTSPVSIYFSEIREIVKSKNGNYTIKGKNAGDVIIIPAQIHDREQLAVRLESIMPIKINNTLTFVEKYQVLAGLIPLVLMLFVYLSENKIIVAVAGTALIILMGGSLVKIYKSKNVDSRTKRGLLWSIIILASVLYVMFLKLGNP
jgi:hypothetical protein